MKTTSGAPAPTRNRHDLLMAMKTVYVTAIFTLASMAVAGVFDLYTRPDFLVMLANQVWASL